MYSTRALPARREPQWPRLMAVIFLSYAREDEARASVVAAGLESRGWSVFWAVFVAVLSPRFITSEKALNS